MALWKIDTGDGARLARGGVSTGPNELLPDELRIDALLSEGADAFRDAVLNAPGQPLDAPPIRVLAPIENQEVWASGVTYMRSRDARKAESTAPDHYDKVYEAQRPELFFKSVGWRVRGPDSPVGIRSDSTWDVPEPELTIVLDGAGSIAAYSIGNDMSSRSIEGENPLYLPQAKTYEGSCAIGPCLVLPDEAPPREELVLDLQILRDGRQLVTERVEVSGMRRTLEELASWLYRAQTFPVGAFLLTGTAIVPEPDFTLRAGDEVIIAVEGLGALRNTVEPIDTSAKAR